MKEKNDAAPQNQVDLHKVGKHRRAPKKVPERAADGADPGNARGATIKVTGHLPRKGARKGTRKRAGKGELTQDNLAAAIKLIEKYKAQAQRRLMSGWFNLDGTPKPYKADPPQVGEVYAWRAWRVVDESFLKSMVTECTWSYYDPLQSNPCDVFDFPTWFGTTLEPKIGIHAWKTKAQVHEYIRWGGYGLPLAVGVVKLWGDIYENEFGYRAEYARVHSICEVRMRYSSVDKEQIIKRRGQGLRMIMHRLQQLYGLKDGI